MSTPPLSEPHLDALKNALEQVCLDTLPKWNSSVGDRMVLKAESVESTTMEQIAPKLGKSAVWFGELCDNAELRIAFGFSNEFAYELLNRLLGTKANGPSTPDCSIADRPLSDLERAVLEQMTRGFFEQLNQLWSRVAQQSLTLESTTGMRCTASSSEPLLWCRLQARILDESNSPFHQASSRGGSSVQESCFLAIPSELLEPHAARLLNHFYSGCPAFKSDSGEAGNPELHIVANLARSTISIEDLEDLKVGDIIATEVPLEHGVEVEVEGVGAFRGRPGIVHGHRAIEICEADGHH